LAIKKSEAKGPRARESVSIEPAPLAEFVNKNLGMI
jgi:hypothetical protein